jgi:hypothetical protein
MVKAIIGHSEGVYDANATSNHEKQFKWVNQSVGGRDRQPGYQAAWVLAPGYEPAVFAQGPGLPDLS